MKKKYRSFLSVVLAVCMIATMVLSTSVFAEEDAVVANGTYTDGVWTEGGDGTAELEVDGNTVLASKTAVPVEGAEDTYDITLRVETTTTQLERDADGAVVLVIDVSGSMADCVECGGQDGFFDSYHKDGCSYYQHSFDDIEATETRIYAAVQEARDFLAAYADSTDTAERQIAIVAFANQALVGLAWTDISGLTGEQARGYMPPIVANGATNLDAGLAAAKALLKSEAVADISQKSVVLLTDGAPTKWLGGGNGSNGSEKNNAAAAAQAEAIQNLGASIYSVCYEATGLETYPGGPKCGEYLASISDYAYTADDTTGLEIAFDNITENITSGLNGEGWIVSDTMTEGVTVVEAPENFVVENGVYTWTLEEPTSQTTENNVTTYVYTLTYRVKVDFTQVTGYEEGAYHPLNGDTILNDEYAFPVPAVKGELPKTTVTVTKEWEDSNDQDGLRPESIKVQLLKNGEPFGDEIELKEENQWTYKWEELVTRANGTDYVYTVQEVEVPEGYETTVETTEEGFVITNVHTAAVINVSVTKVWEDVDDQAGLRPDSVTVYLVADGIETDKFVVLSEENEWTAYFDGLPVYNQGKEIVYSVSEVKVNGYSTLIEQEEGTDNFTVINTHAPEYIVISGTKTWDDENNKEGLRPDSITINLLANGEKVASVEVGEAENWTWYFQAAKLANGEEIVYTITEETVEGYTAVVDGYNVTNTLISEKVEDSQDSEDGSDKGEESGKPEESDKSEESQKPTDSEEVSTGDYNNMGLYVAVAILSLVAVAVLTTLKKVAFGK